MMVKIEFKLKTGQADGLIMAISPEMVDSVNIFILARQKRNKKKEHFWSENFCGYNAQNLCMRSFSLVICCWISPEQCEATYYSKNSGIIGNFGWEAQSNPRYSPNLARFISTCLTPQRISAWNKVFKQGWSEALCKQIRDAFNKFPDFFCMGTFIDSTYMKL